MSFNLKTFLGVLVVVAVAAAGAFFFMPRNVDAPQTDAAPAGKPGIFGEGEGGEPYAALITYTEKGYEPARVEIKRGESVRFLNSAKDQETWPASAVHPTHSIYPDRSANDCLGSSFDACVGLTSGTWWQYQFDQPGEWRFHDHIHPSKTGVVVVTE